jgi:hypothetical protein
MQFYLGGEGKLSVGRALKFAQQGAAMVVNCAPFGCMPETVATSIFGRLSTDAGIPVVSLFYDGSGGQNRRLEVFLQNAIRGIKSGKPFNPADYQLPGDFGGAEALIPAQNLLSKVRPNQAGDA